MRRLIVSYQQWKFIIIIVVYKQIERNAYQFAKVSFRDHLRQSKNVFIGKCWIWIAFRLSVFLWIQIKHWNRNFTAQRSFNRFNISRYATISTTAFIGDCKNRTTIHEMQTFFHFNWFKIKHFNFTLHWHLMDLNILECNFVINSIITKTKNNRTEIIRLFVVIWFFDWF